MSASPPVPKYPPRAAPARRITPLWRKSAILGHVAGFGMLLGGTAAVNLLVCAGEANNRVHCVEVLTAAAQVQDWLVRPGFAAALLTGAMLVWVGPFGLVRYRWMIAKLVLTAILFMHSQVEYRPLTHALRDVAAGVTGGSALPATWSEDIFHLTRVGVIQIAVALFLAGLGVFKPWGQTRWGKGGR